MHCRRDVSAHNDGSPTATRPAVKVPMPVSGAATGLVFSEPVAEPSGGRKAKRRQGRYESRRSECQPVTALSLGLRPAQVPGVRTSSETDAQSHYIPEVCD